MADYKTLFLQLSDILLVNTFFVYFLFYGLQPLSDKQLQKTNVFFSV